MAQKKPRHIHPHNPLDKDQLGVSIGDALLGQPVVAISEIEPFVGAGIYAIYYSGPLAAYAEVAKKNRNGRFEFPIYVGKVAPLVREREESALGRIPEQCFTGGSESI